MATRAHRSLDEVFNENGIGKRLYELGKSYESYL